MRRTLCSALVLAVCGAPLMAQNECATAGYSGSPGAACQTFVDAARTFHPVLGVLVSGGNPVLGSGGALGGLGHIFVTGRVNAAKISVPDPQQASQPSVPSSFDGIAPAPIVEAGMGLFRGMTGGLLSVDALGSAVLLPTGVVSDLSVDPDAPNVGSVALGVGYGVRVGILKGSFPVPSLSASIMRRHVPRLQYGDVSAGDDVQFATDLDATNIRVAAGFRFVLVDVAAGVGWDRYSSSAEVAFVDPTRLTNPQRMTLDLNNSRAVLFVNGGLNFALMRLVAELGYQTGKDQNLTTNFSDFDPKAGHVFGGIGFRFGF